MIGNLFDASTGFAVGLAGGWIAANRTSRQSSL
jgi:hypothetical protein